MAENKETNDERRLRNSKIFLVVYNICNMIFGLGCLGVGMWLNIDKNVHAYLSIMVRTASETAVTATTVLLIVAGILLIAMSLLCFYALLRQNGNLLLLYTLFLFFVLILLITGGFILVVFREQIPYSVKDGMRAQIQEYYTHDNRYGLSWNRVQVMQRCCGVDGSWDYYMSNWWISQNPGAETVADAAIHVPDSCCKLTQTEDRDVWWVDPQKCTPKDRKKCNEDAQGRRDGSDYVNGMGCYAAVTAAIYPHMVAIAVISLVIGFFQVIGIVVAFSTAMTMKHMNSKY